MTSIKKADVSSSPLSFKSREPFANGRFPEAPDSQGLGENLTLARHAPDVISALGASTTIGELRERTGLSVSKLASLPEAERAVILDVVKRSMVPIGESFERKKGAPVT